MKMKFVDGGPIYRKFPQKWQWLFTPFVQLFAIALAFFASGCSRIGDEKADFKSISAPLTQITAQPAQVSDNPFWNRVLLELEKLNNELDRQIAHEAQATTARQLRDIYHDLDFWAWAYVAQNSVLAGDDRLRKKIHSAFLDIARHENEGSFTQPGEREDANMDRFILATIGQAWLWLKIGADDLTAALAGNVLPIIERGAINQMRVFGKPGPHPHGPTWYPNIDATWALQIWTAGTIFENQKWIDAALERWQITADRIYPGGGWTYMGHTNPEPAYQTVAVRQLGRFYIHSRNQLAMMLANQLKDYYPRITEAGGVTEGSTSPFWKQRWDAITPDGPGIIAGLSGCSENASLANYLANYYLENTVNWVRGDILTAALLYPGSSNKWIFTDRILLDPDSGGPRGRFNRWSFATSGRDWKDDRGKITYAGVMLLDEYDQSNGRAYPLNAALKTAGFEIQIAGRTFDLTMNDQCEWVIENDWTTFSSLYDYQQPVHGGGRSRAVPWHGSQQWLFTPKRAVFAISLWAEGRLPADALNGIIRVGNGRGLPIRNHPRTDFSVADEHSFSLGNLVFRLHLTDFTAQTITDDVNYRGHTSAVRFTDERQENPLLFPSADTPRILVIEAYIKHQGPSVVDFSRPSQRIARLEVQNQQGHWIMTHNCSKTAFTETLIPAKYFLSNNSADIDTVLPNNGNTMEIEPGHHLVQFRASSEDRYHK